RRFLVAPVFPREILIPAPPFRVGIAGLLDTGLPRQGQIADRDDAPAAGGGKMPALVSKGVELFGIAKLKACLLAHPLAQARLQRAVLDRIERTEGQG